MNGLNIEVGYAMAAVYLVTRYNYDDREICGIFSYEKMAIISVTPVASNCIEITPQIV